MQGHLQARPAVSMTPRRTQRVYATAPRGAARTAPLPSLLFLGHTSFMIKGSMVVLEGREMIEYMKDAESMR